MNAMRYANEQDIAFWIQMDSDVTVTELRNKIQHQRCYIVMDGGIPIGILRYNLFWDSIPFLTRIIIKEESRLNGFGCKALHEWEVNMKKQGYQAVMISTQSNETAQHFYRKFGYKDAGCLLLNIPSLEQPLEIFMVKEI